MESDRVNLFYRFIKWALWAKRTYDKYTFECSSISTAEDRNYSSIFFFTIIDNPEAYSQYITKT